MRLVLTNEVRDLGGPGDVVEVADGYGRNYLLPRGLAVRATRGTEKQVAELRRTREQREIRDLDGARVVADQLAGLRPRVDVRAGEGGRLYGAVTPQLVVEAVSAAGGPLLDRRRLEMPDHLKSTGTYRVSVRLHPEVLAAFDVDVVAAAA